MGFIVQPAPPYLVPRRAVTLGRAVPERRRLNLKAKFESGQSHFSFKSSVSGAVDTSLIGSTCTAIPCVSRLVSKSFHFIGFVNTSFTPPCKARCKRIASILRRGCYQTEVSTAGARVVGTWSKLVA